ncbi:hypothetical protein DSECCO2_542080 [anaerobic digester metagenome]
MKANKKTLMAVKHVLELEQEFWDKEEMISSIIHDTNMLCHSVMGEQTLSPDECEILWGKDEICNLDDFIKRFSDLFIEKICNILDFICRWGN